MSDAKPFAEVRSTPPSFFLYVGGRCLRDANVSKRLDEHAAAINAAVARERREAVASALNDMRAWVTFDGDRVEVSVRVRHEGEQIGCAYNGSVRAIEACKVPEALRLAVFGLDTVRREAAAEALEALADEATQTQTQPTVYTLRTRAAALRKGGG